MSRSKARFISVIGTDWKGAGIDPSMLFGSLQEVKADLASIAGSPEFPDFDKSTDVATIYKLVPVAKVRPGPRPKINRPLIITPIK